MPELHYRDLSSAGSPAAWIAVADSRWAWHAGLWMPEHRLNARVYHLIREAIAESRPGGAPPFPLPPAARTLSAFLRRRDPPRPNTVREFRIVVRDQHGEIAGQPLRSFAEPSDAVAA